MYPCGAFTAQSTWCGHSSSPGGCLRTGQPLGRQYPKGCPFYPQSRHRTDQDLNDSPNTFLAWLLIEQRLFSTPILRLFFQFQADESLELK